MTLFFILFCMCLVPFDKASTTLGSIEPPSFSYATLSLTMKVRGWFPGPHSVFSSVKGSEGILKDGQSTSTRTSPHQIGSIMALLAVFDEAQVLPPEGSSEATRLVHALIQSQSAFLKSQNPAVRKFFSQALRSYFFDRATSVESNFYSIGWNSEVLEAIVLYTGYPNTWSDLQLAKGLKVFNVTREDLYEIQVVFDQARQRFIRLNRDIHDVFRLKRREMLGG